MLFSNSSSVHKGNYSRGGVWICDLNQSRFFTIFFSVFSFILTSSIACKTGGLANQRGATTSVKRESKKILALVVAFHARVSRFALCLATSIKKIYQTLETVFDQISKHLEIRVIFPTLFSLFGTVVKHGLQCLIFYQNVCFVFEKQDLCPKPNVSQVEIALA